MDPEGSDGGIDAAIERIKTIAWRDPEGRMLVLSAGPMGMTITMFDETSQAEMSATLRGGRELPDFTKFIFECAAEFGGEWRARN